MSKLVQLPITLAKYSGPKFAKFLKYARVELTPPSPTELGEVMKGFRNLSSGFAKGNWRNVTVQQALVNTCVTIEVAMWFFIGECIGKRHLIGYYVPP